MDLPHPPLTLEIRLFSIRISPITPSTLPPHLTLSLPSLSLSLRRDRVDLDTPQVTYLTTDSRRLSDSTPISISDDRGHRILTISLKKDANSGWTMDCSTDDGVDRSAFVGNDLLPGFEVYVAGSYGGAPLILTQTVQVVVKRKAGDDGVEGEETVKRRKGTATATAASSVMEPFHSKPQSRAHMGQTCPLQPVNHSQYPPQFTSQASPLHIQFQGHPVQPSSPVVQMLPQYQQPHLNSQYSHMQPQCQPQRSSQSQAHDQNQSQEQLQCTNKRRTLNKRWKPNYDDFLIPFLVEQAREGMKVDKTFKRHAFVAAASAVNTRFRESFTWENVENHMRTLKTKYQEIKKCREFNGASWNEDLKMITLDDATYQAYIEGNPKAKEYVNKPIENYEGLKIICGDGPVIKKSNFQPPKTGDAMDLYQEPVGHDEEVEAPVVGSTCTEVPTQTGHAAPTSPSSSRNGRAYKRSRDNIESIIMELARKVGDVAEAINNVRPTHWTAELYDKVMDLDDFDSTIQEAAFDTLRLDEAEARAFIVKNKMMRYSWMERFVADRFSD